MIVRDFTRCPRCGSPTKKAISFSGGESEFWYECTDNQCNTYINTYVPQAHQAKVHTDSHRYLGNFGGYGSGKTTTSREEFYKHMLLTPGGATIIGANVASQYEQTIKRDIENDIPRGLVKGYSTKNQYIDFLNDHRLLFRPFDDPNKLRSYNVTMFIMLEASEIKAEVFTQLKTRLRNLAATIPEVDDKGRPVTKRLDNGSLVPIIKHDWRKGIVESNPDSGWIRNEVLLVSDTIQKHGPILDEYNVLEQEKDKAIGTHITVSDVNQFLPPNFKEEITKNKPLWWISRYIHGSFSYAEGLVYPNAMRYLVEDFEIPKHWKRICAYDYGLSDDSVYLFGAVDEINCLLYIYKEVRTNNKNVEDLAMLFKEASADIPIGGWICSPIIDPKSAPKRDYEKKSLADHFLDYGVVFIPGKINVDARIFRVNTYIESGKLRIFEKGCEGLVKELRDYKFKNNSHSNDSYADKPQDKNNHAINPLEWICMELPSDPSNLVYGIYNRQGQDLTKLGEQKLKEQAAFGTFALEDDYTPRSGPFDSIDYMY